MTKLEPTRTSSDLTATERLRSMLDERGVEWHERVWGGRHSVTTFWNARGVRWHYRENRFGELRLHADGLDPAQAIAATLGDVPCLPYWWTLDGTLHIELPRLPESISVRLPDQRDREVGSARTWQYALGSGTCHNIAPTYLDFLCSECGFVHYHSDENDSGDGNEWHYCPNCGAKVAD